MHACNYPRQINVICLDINQLFKDVFPFPKRPFPYGLEQVQFKKGNVVIESFKKIKSFRNRIKNN